MQLKTQDPFIIYLFILGNNKNALVLLVVLQPGISFK